MTLSVLRNRLTRIVIIVALLFIVGWTAWDFAERRHLSSAVAAIRTAGQPLTLDRWKAPGSGEAAALYAGAAAAVINHGSPRRREPETDVLALSRRSISEWSPADLASAQARLSTFAEVFAFADRAALLEFSSYPPGPAFTPSGGDLAIVEQLLELRTAVAALRGDAESAANALVSEARFLRTFDDAHWPPGISDIDREDLEAVLERTSPSEAQFERIRAALASIDRADTFERYVLRDRTLFVQEFWPLLQDIVPADVRPDEAIVDGSTTMAWLGRPLKRWRLADTFDMQAAVLEAARRGPLLRSLKALAAQPRGLFVWEQRLGVEGWAMRGIRESWLRKYAVVAPRMVRGQAIARAGQVAIAALLYRRVHGSLPPDLATLAATLSAPLPLDPVTGQPLKYAAGPDDFVVYSLGEDERDDGGRQAPMDDAARQRLQRITAEPDWGVRIRIR